MGAVADRVKAVAQDVVDRLLVGSHAAEILIQRGETAVALG